MTAPALVLGVDPGRTVGIAALRPDAAPELAQTTPDGARDLVARYLCGTTPAVLAIEQFVVGRRAARSAHAGAGQTTRDLIGACTEIGAAHGARVVTVPAGVHKPWSTDARLEAAGAHGARHARDAARVALYVACRQCGFPDPLSVRHRSPRCPR